VVKVLADLIPVLGPSEPGLCSLGNELENVPAEVSAFKRNGFFQQLVKFIPIVVLVVNKQACKEVCKLYSEPSLSEDY